MKRALLALVSSAVCAACDDDLVVEPPPPPPSSEQVITTDDDDDDDDCGFVASTFSFPRDELSCAGDQLVKFDDRYGLTVGVVLCGDRDAMRVYLSNDGTTFFPAADTGGHGQDHCELINPDFTSLPDEDDITSGGCDACSDGRSFSLEGMSVWVRARLGQQFQLVASAPVWSHRAAILKCGYDVARCEQVTESDPVDNGPVFVAPPAPQGDVQCEPGGTAFMSYVITAVEMSEGAGDQTGPGVCAGNVTFNDDLGATTTGTLSVGSNAPPLQLAEVDYNGQTTGCDDGVGEPEYHCGSLTYGDGRVEPRYCTVWARCDPETLRAQAVGFTW
jgi:hypothetical protein